MQYIEASAAAGPFPGSPLRPRKYERSGPTQNSMQSPYEKMIASVTVPLSPASSSTTRLDGGESPNATAKLSSPLYPGVNARTGRLRTTVPVSPNKQSFRGELTATTTGRSPTASQFSPSATSSSPAAASASPSSSSPSSRAPHRSFYSYSSLPIDPVPVFDPCLPSPIVVVHPNECRTVSVNNKNVPERKHRGTSRNDEGGFYTS